MTPIVQLIVLVTLVLCLGFILGNLHRRGLSAGQLRAQLDQMRHLIQLSILHSERRTMTAIQDLDAKVDTLSAELEAANGKSDALIATLADVKAQLAALIAAGNGASDADINAIAAKIDAALASTKAQEAEDDAALAP